jgi:hypothetical protein
VAVGAMAIGAVAIKRLKIKGARIKRLEIDELVVRRIIRPPRKNRENSPSGAHAGLAGPAVCEEPWRI